MRSCFGLLALSICCFWFDNCSAQPPSRVFHFPNGKVCVLLDSIAAGNAITTDHIDGYFEKVNASEISIQMHQPIQENMDRNTMLAKYRAYLKTDVESFSDDDVRFLEKVMEKVSRTSTELSPDIFPDTLKLIKTKANHYGEGVWYTRENCIIIPIDELKRAKTNGFTVTMYHELFHVWSRLHPEKSAQAYRLIGFESLGWDKLQMPPGLAARVLFNPDGVDFAQKIALAQPDGSTIYAIPVIYANSVGWTAQQTSFFSYLEFNLFRIEKQTDGKWKVLVQEDGYHSTIDVNKEADFQRQIKDNTGYIIHPDEVLADNFSFLMQDRNGQKVSMRFSEEGKKLLVDLEGVMKGK